MSKPGVSVVIPLFNQAEYIDRSIASVLAQEREPEQVVVVDDGSTDDGAARIEALDDPRIKLVRQANTGVSAARNRGISESSHEMVAFLDADDEWLPGHLQSLVELAGKYPAAGLLANGFRVTGPGYERDCTIGEAHRVFSPDIYLAAVLTGNYPVWTSAAMVRKSAFDAIEGGFMTSHTHGEDHALWLLLVLDHGLAVSGSIGAVYHQNLGGLAGRLVTEPDALMVTIDRILADRHELSEGFRELLEEYSHRFALAIAANALLRKERAVAKAFLDISSSTRRYAARWRALKILQLSGDFLSGLFFRYVLKYKNIA